MNDLIPDRLSVDDLADHDADFGQRLIITLDGILQTSVVAYDVGSHRRAGMLTRLKVDNEGNYIVDAVHDCIMRETVCGDVVVTLLPH